MEWIHTLEQLILTHAGAWWTYALTTVLCWLDGFFPPLPSESIVIAMASLSAGGHVKLWILLPLVVVGAFIGDNSAYWIGRMIPLERWFSGEKGARIVSRAHDLVHRKGPQVLLTARFIPVYRVAINMTAGAVRYPVATFMAIDVVASSLWTVFSIAIGLASGSFFRGHPLLGIVAGIILGLLVGVVIDHVTKRLRNGSDDAAPEEP